jgi:hypothetical protein
MMKHTTQKMFKHNTPNTIPPAHFKKRFGGKAKPVCGVRLDMKTSFLG